IRAWPGSGRSRGPYRLPRSTEKRARAMVTKVSRRCLRSGTGRRHELSRVRSPHAQCPGRHAGAVERSPEAARGAPWDAHPATRRPVAGYRGRRDPYDTWVGWGGEGIVLKEPNSIYRPGIRSPAWLKVKPKVTLEVVVTGGSSEAIAWGLAIMLDIAPTSTLGMETSSRYAKPSVSGVTSRSSCTQGTSPTRSAGGDSQ